MKVDRSAMMRALKSAAAITERRNTIPILGHVRLLSNMDGLSIEATDLDIALRTTLHGVTDKSLDTCMAAPDRVYALLRAFEGDDIELGPEVKGRIDISGGRASAAISTLPGGDWPVMERGAEAWRATLGEEFFSLMARVQFAVSKEETRYYLNGIYMHHVADWTYRLVATDGHRLIYADVQLPDAPVSAKSKWSDGVIIPRKTISAMLRLHKENRSAPVRLTLGGVNGNSQSPLAGGSATRLGMSLPTGWNSTVEMWSKLIDGTFPDYSRVVPKQGEAKHRAEMSVADIRRVMGGFNGSASERTRVIKLTFSKGLLQIERASSVEEVVPTFKIDVDYSGDGFVVGFNANYLAQQVIASGGERVVCEADSEASPSLWYDPSSAAVRTVLMPARV